MATRATLRAMARELLAAAAYPDASIDAWIGEAIRAYSLWFPYRASDEVLGSAFSAARTCSLGLYDNAPGLNVFRVEYPAYEDPPRYLTRLGESHPAFYGGDYFDLRAGTPPLLVLGRLPAASEALVIHLETSHPAPLDDVTALTIPEQHLEALVLFVLWRAHVEALMIEEAAPDHASDVLSRLSLNTERAELAYKAKLAEYREALVTGGFSGPWPVDRFDRVY